MDNYQSTFLDALRCADFSSPEHELPFLIGAGKDNAPVAKDLAALPHLVIAGATGTGKSTLAHAILLSLISVTSPDRLKLFLCDTKAVELGVYKSIAHLLAPIAVDPDKISAIISWTDTEVSRRLRLLSESGLRHFSAYNSYLRDRSEPELPHILLVIDDISDAINTHAPWNSLQHIAQTGRSVGIHMILITQNAGNKNLVPILSGSIPARAVFNVFTNTEEKLLLGASKNAYLSNVGEIIFCTIPGWAKERIRCYPITDMDISSILSGVSKQAQDLCSPPLFSPEATEKREEASALQDGDEMLSAAVDVILETGQASVSMIQRRLMLGYARAARIIDEMEEKGIVGPFQGSKPRTILITKEQWKVASSAANIYTGSLAHSPGAPECPPLSENFSTDLVEPSQVCSEDTPPEYHPNPVKRKRSRRFLDIFK